MATHMRDFATLSYRGQVGRLRGLARLALAEFGIAEARLTLLAHFDNTTFRVTVPSGERFVLRIHRAHGSPSHPPRSVAEVRSELAWLAALRRDAGLAVPVPRRTPDGEPLVVVERPGVPDPRVCVLFEWLDGRFLNAGLTPAHLERVGVFIARLHDQAQTWTPPDDFTRWQIDVFAPQSVDWSRSLIRDHAAPGDLPTFDAVIERVHAAQRELAALPDSHGLIHSDLHQENYLFDAAGNLLAIDFDECGYGPLLWDLCVPLNELWGRDDLPQLRDALLRGYTSLRPLPPNHAALLETFDAARILILTLWHIENRDNPRFSYWRKELRGNLDWLGRWIATQEKPPTT